MKEKVGRRVEGEGNIETQDAKEKEKWGLTVGWFSFK